MKVKIKINYYIILFLDSNLFANLLNTNSIYLGDFYK